MKIIMDREDLDVSKYEQAIKKVYPFLSDKFIKDLTYELYVFCQRLAKEKIVFHTK